MSAGIALGQDVEKKPKTVAPFWKNVAVVNAPQPAAGKTAAAPTANASKVHVDQATGKTKEPDAGESAELSQLFQQTLSPSPTNLQPVKRPDGSIMVELGEEFMNISVAHIGADGKLVEECLPAGSKVVQPSQPEKPKTAPAKAQGGRR